MTTVEYTKPMEMRLILLCLIGLIGCPSALAGEKVSGRALFLATPSTTIPIGADDEQHVLRHVAERGTQIEFTSSDSLKDCSLLRTGSCDLVRGKGTCYGYQIWVAPNGDRLVAKFSGVPLPETAADNNLPVTLLRGTWVYVRGSGKFVGVKGAGVYQGRYISASEYELEWNGELDRAPMAEPTNAKKD